MRGTMHRLPDGTLSARLTDRWGYIHTLTGTRTADGYDVEVLLTGMPESLALPGDDEHFEVVR